jgi:hypothetical protein
MAAMIVTCLIMVHRALRTKLEIIEMISFRFATSIYAGWLCAAFIVSTATLLKREGWSEANGYNEITPSLTMLWIAFAIYAATTIINRDPLFGALWLWAGSAVRAKQTDE